MPLIMVIMDAMSNGKPVSSTYFDIWCRAWDECFVTLDKSREMAFHAGFTGQRAELTWKGRIRLLAELGFIDVKPGPSGDMSYALIWNPYLVIKEHWKNKKPGFTEDLWNALVQRTIQIGAKDLNPQKSSSKTASKTNMEHIGVATKKIPTKKRNVP
jgi:hypothetical protein